MKLSMIALGLVLAGCTGGMNVQSANTDAVTIQYMEGRKDAADAEANKQCSAFGKRAKFRNTHDASNKKWAIYDCVV